MHIKSLPARLADKLGLAYLSKEFLTFVRMHGFFTLATNLSGMFIGTFLLKSGGDLFVVGMFYIIWYFLESTINIFTTQLLGKFSPTLLSRIGLVFYTASYVFLLVFRDSAISIFPLIALLSALGACFYWLPYHIYNVQYTHLGNRQLGISLMGVIANLIVLVTPSISGSVIYLLPGMTGYLAVFFISVVAFIAAAITTRGMPSRPTGQKGNPLLRIIKYDLRDKLVSKMALAHVFYGIREGLFSYYLNLLIFTATSSELIIGFNTTGRSVLVMITYTLIAKYNTPEVRRWAIIGSGLLAVLTAGGVTLYFTTFTIIALSLIDAVLQSYNLNMFQLVTYGLSDHLTKKSGTDRRIEVISLRSLTLNIGRVFGILLFLIMPQSNYALILLLLSVIALPSAFILRGMEREIV